VKTVSGKVVKSFTGLSNGAQMLGGMVGNCMSPWT